MRIRLECETDQPKLAGRFAQCAHSFWSKHRCSKSISGGDLRCLDKSQDVENPRPGQYLEFRIDNCMVNMDQLQKRLEKRGFRYQVSLWGNASRTGEQPEETSTLVLRFLP